MTTTASADVTFQLGMPEKRPEMPAPKSTSGAKLIVLFLLPLAVAVAAVAVAARLWMRVDELETTLNSGVIMTVNATSPAGYVRSHQSLLTGSGSWAPGPRLPFAHSDNQAIFCAGRVVILGGQDDNQTHPTVLSDVATFDPVHEVFTSGLAPMPTPRYRFGAACHEGRVYVAGGFVDAAAGAIGLSVATVDIYDVVGNSWSAGPPLGVPRGDLALASAAGTLYAIGGYDHTYTPLATTERLTTGGIRGSWELAAPMRNPKGDLQAAVIGSRIYVPGGWNVERTFLNELAVYDAHTDAWTLGPNMSAPRGDGAVVALGGRVYIIGGEMWSGETTMCDWGWGPEECAVNLIPMHGVEMYAPDDGVWTSLAPLPESRFRFAAAAVEGRASEGAIYAFGGHAHGEVAVDSTWTFHDVPRANLFIHARAS